MRVESLSPSLFVQAKELTVARKREASDARWRGAAGACRWRRQSDEPAHWSRAEATNTWWEHIKIDIERPKRRDWNIPRSYETGTAQSRAPPIRYRAPLTSVNCKRSDFPGGRFCDTGVYGSWKQIKEEALNTLRSKFSDATEVARKQTEQEILRRTWSKFLQWYPLALSFFDSIQRAIAMSQEVVTHSLVLISTERARTMRQNKQEGTKTNCVWLTGVGGAGLQRSPCSAKIGYGPSRAQHWVAGQMKAHRDPCWG